MRYPDIVLRQVTALILLVGATAIADPAPAPAPVPMTRAAPGTTPQQFDPHHHPPSGLGLDFVFGWAGQRHGPSGYVARLDYELYPVLAPSRVAGWVFVFHAGFEYWRFGDDNWGVSMPFTFALGLRVFPVRILGGVGFDTIVVDQVANDTGFGLFAPLAMARASLDLFGAQVGVDARYAYHWLLGADDHARWQLGLFVGGTMESGRARARPFY